MSDLSKAFIIGSPRSGTTWLRLLLAQHDNVATSSETGLFSNYIRKFEQSWDWQKKNSNVGLPALISEGEFYDYCSGFADSVIDKIALSNPRATLVVEKTPAHVRHTELIRKTFPDAYFLHIVRDPRSVVSSLAAASRASFGRKWAKSDVIWNSQQWNGDFKAGEQLAQRTKRYFRIHYEQLLADNANEKLLELLDWLSLPADINVSSEILERCHIENLRKGDARVRSLSTKKSNLTSFYRKGEPDSWKQDLSLTDICTTELVTASGMTKLGYSRHVEQWPVEAVSRTRLSAKRVMKSLKFSIRQITRRAFG